MSSQKYQLFKLSGLLLALACLGLWGPPSQAWAAPAAQVSAPASLSGGPIIADHTVVDQHANIPQAYIDLVKEMWLTVPGESHSLGYRLGCTLLEAQDSRFQVNVTESGTPEGYTDQYLRVSRATWGDVGSPTGWRYGYGEEDWYTSAQAIARTRDGITYANTHSLAIAAMGFGWCWDMTWHNNPGGTIDPVYQVRWAGSSVGGPDGDLRWGLDADDYDLTSNHVNLNTYLDATEQYVAHSNANGYPTRVFFTTGPVDGGGNTGENGYQRHLKNQGIRQHVYASSDRVLLDYADLLTWGNDGTQRTTTWTDYGGAAQTYPYIHADNMLDLDGTYTEDGDHIGQRGALRLGKALWWMLARLAGWDGVTGNRAVSVANGDWSLATVWDTGVAPQANDGVTIAAGTAVTVNVNSACTSLLIEPGARLFVPTGVTLSVTESFINQGTIQVAHPVNNSSVAFQIGDEARGIIRYRMAQVTSPNNLGTVTVSVRALNAGEYCTSTGGNSNPYAQRCFEIEATNSAPTTVRLWAFDDEMNGVTAPQVYRYEAPNWIPLTANAAAGAQTGYTYTEAETPGFSHFLIAGAEAPTAIRLLDLQAQSKSAWLPLAGVLALAGIGVGMIWARRVRHQ
jgi:hypothetical protein